MFLRESRWSRTIAALNILALLLAIGGLAIYKLGYYPTEIHFRIVDSKANATELSKALQQRLNGLADAPYIPGTDPFAPPSSSSVLNSSLVTVDTWEYKRTQVVEVLSIENTVQLAWLPGATSSAAAVETGLLGQDSTILEVGAGLKVSNQTEHVDTALGRTVQAFSRPLSVAPDMVAKVNQDSNDGSISIELSAKGRAHLLESAPDSTVNAALGLVVDGVIEAITGKNASTGRKLSFQLSTNPDVTMKAIIASIRGPAIPTDLELLP